MSEKEFEETVEILAEGECFKEHENEIIIKVNNDTAILKKSENIYSSGEELPSPLYFNDITSFNLRKEYTSKKIKKIKSLKINVKITEKCKNKDDLINFGLENDDAPGSQIEPTFTKKEIENYERQKEKSIFKSPTEEYLWAKTQKKTCSKCLIEKKLCDFNGNTSGTDAFDKNGYRLRRPECKECTKYSNKGKTEAKKKSKRIGYII